MAKPTGKKDRAKYDWIALKEDFFRSEYIDVSPWIRHTLGQEKEQNKNVRLACAGWALDKKIWKEERLKETLAKIKEDRVARSKVLLDKIFLKIEADLNYLIDRESHNTEDTKRLWEMARTENDMPTKILYNKNEDMNFDRETAKQNLLEKIISKANDKPGRTAKGKPRSKSVQRREAIAKSS